MCYTDDKSFWHVLAARTVWRNHQSHLYRSAYLAGFFLLAVSVTIILAVPSSQPKTGNRSVSINSRQRSEVIKDLPPISSFKETPPSRFLVDMTHVRRGHPYMGRRAKRPHTGGHVYFNTLSKAKSLSVQDYPPIYAVADGVITRIDYSYELRSMFEPAIGKAVANRRYGIGLTFAKDGATPITFHYSIEPFVRPNNDNFYDKFIFVKLGQTVKKGDVIARMYLPPNTQLASKSHIHFNLLREGGGGFISPSIFDPTTVRLFHARWNLFPNNPDAPIPPCMGYFLEADENPFERRAIDRL